MSPHYIRVRQFMGLAKQVPPFADASFPLSPPAMPNEKARLLRAKLIIEEALETVHALGVTVTNHGLEVKDGLEFHSTHEPSLVDIADGCADIAVVTTGTLIACNIDDTTLMSVVDNNNLAKFGPGHSFREDGKLIKPPGHTPPDIAALLRRQGWTG